MTPSRFEAVEIPPRMRHLPKDKRGYPVPFNVMRGEDGTPYFTVNDEQVRQRCIHEDLCGICGGKLFNIRWFVGGPMSFLHPQGAIIDTGMHEECATYALQVCPYLAAPSYSKRIDDKPVKQADRDRVLIMEDPTMIANRPEPFMGVAIRRKDCMLIPDRMNLFIRYIKPDRTKYTYMSFWNKGQRLTVEEGTELVAKYFADKGLLNLRDPHAQGALNRGIS